MVVMASVSFVSQPSRTKESCDNPRDVFFKFGADGGWQGGIQ